MNLGKWICLAVIGLTLLGAMAYADDKLDSAVIDAVTDFYGLYDQDVELEFRKNLLTSQFSDIDNIEIEPMTQGKSKGVISVRVSLYNGAILIEKKQVRLMVRHFANVIVSNQLIRRHKELNRTNISSLRMDVTYLTDDPIVLFDRADQCWARRNIKKDQIITEKIIEPIPLIRQQSEITIVYTNDIFQISAPGRALEQGNIGDRIRIQNSQSKRIVSGTVVDQSTVTVKDN